MGLIGLWRDETCKIGVNGIVEFKERRKNIYIYIYKWGNGIEMTGSYGGLPIPVLRFLERAADFIQSEQTESGVHPSFR
jgi:hypothetical protein